jgi:hypothetical protein
MSKKNKRQISRAGSNAAGSRGNEFNPDYSITKRELRRIGILAGTFFVILIILAIFQNPLLALITK